VWTCDVSEILKLPNGQSSPDVRPFEDDASFDCKSLKDSVGLGGLETV
jgi:hypothetical protein